MLTYQSTFVNCSVLCFDSYNYFSLLILSSSPYITVYIMPPSPEFNRSARAVTSIPLSLMAHADQGMKTSPKIQYTVNHTPQNWQPVNQFHSSLLQQCLWYQTPSVYLGWVQQLALPVRQSKVIAQSISLFQHSSHKYLPSRLYCSFYASFTPAILQGIKVLANLRPNTADDFHPVLSEPHVI